MAPGAGERRGQSWTNGPSRPSQALLERKEPASAWRRLHLPMNPRRREAKPQQRSGKVAGCQWGPTGPSLALCPVSSKMGSRPLDPLTPLLPSRGPAGGPDGDRGPPKYRPTRQVRRGPAFHPRVPGPSPGLFPPPGPGVCCSLCLQSPSPASPG